MRLLDLFCGAGGAARGYQLAGFYVVGVDIRPQPRYVGDEFVQADALEYLEEYGRDFDAIHASPPCQGYSIMNKLPWLRGREYPLLILPCMEMLEALGKPYVLENVMGARHGAKGLKKRGLEAHGLQAGWLCGTMFGLPFYRHRLFATNWLWLAPEHPKHMLNLHPRAERYVYGGTVKGLPGGAGGLDIRPRTLSQQAALASADSRGLETWPGRRDQRAGLTPRQGYEHVGGINAWCAKSNQAMGHNGPAKGWRLAAEAMGIDWMKRAELTQAIPPAYTEFIGRQLMAYLTANHHEAKAKATA